MLHSVILIVVAAVVLHLITVSLTLGALQFPSLVVRSFVMLLLVAASFYFYRLFLFHFRSQFVEFVFDCQVPPPPPSHHPVSYLDVHEGEGWGVVMSAFPAICPISLWDT